jgi:hypothetical protein
MTNETITELDAGAVTESGEIQSGEVAEQVQETPAVTPAEPVAATVEPVVEPVAPIAPAAPAVTSVSANSALVEWPRDEWGSLSNLRKELLLAASNIRGQDDKQEVFLNTLKTAAMHAIARFSADKTALIAEVEYENNRIARQNGTGRVYGTPVQD